MGVKVKRRESQLWPYLSYGDGNHCPVYGHCSARIYGETCADKEGDKIRRLIEIGDEFDPGDHDFVKPRRATFNHDNENQPCQLVEKLATKYLYHGQVFRPPVPLELVSLADRIHPIEVRLVSLKTCHGALWRVSEGWIIHLNKNDTSATNRLTLFHEAFHILAHCKSIHTPVFETARSVQGSFNELLADFFAISVLIPQKWVEQTWAEIKDLNRMASIFDVPKPALWFRLRTLGLT